MWLYDLAMKTLVTRRLVQSLAATTALVLVGCGGSRSTEGERVSSVATVFPLAWLAEQIAPDAALTNLATRGGDPHGLELGPQDRVSLEQADVVVYLGQIDFQPQVEEAVAASTTQVVSAAEVVGENALLLAEADSHDQGEGAGDHEAEVADPHLWFDPGLMAAVGEAVGQAFAEVDPVGAAQYRANASSAAEDLRGLEEEIATILSNCEHQQAIVSHEAYGYLLAPHALEQQGIAGIDPESGASPAELAALVEEIRAEDIPAVLAEPVEGRADAEALAAEAGVDLLEISSLESATEEEQQSGYPELLRQQALAFAQALRCRG